MCSIGEKDYVTLPPIISPPSHDNIYSFDQPSHMIFIYTFIYKWDVYKLLALRNIS